MKRLVALIVAVAEQLGRAQHTCGAGVLGCLSNQQIDQLPDPAGLDEA